MQRDERFDQSLGVRKVKKNGLPEHSEEDFSDAIVAKGRFPSWLHRPLPKGQGLVVTEQIMRKERLHTVCEEASCPNLFECWSKKTATFLIMGKECTRNCGFCDIDFSKVPPPLDPMEPQKVARSVETLGLKHVVITMVARDDLLDQGAEHLTEVIRAVRSTRPKTTIEVLTSDFQGDQTALRTVLREKPDVFNHNIETVRLLTPRVRHNATYERTLQVLEQAAMEGQSLIKSGLMVGLGETKEQVYETIDDLHAAGCHIITIGQYLQPNQRKLRVKAFISPEEFAEYAEYGKKKGVSHMYCGPFVRSSYNAHSFSRM